MADPAMVQPVPDLTHTSMAEVIHGIAVAIADAQFELDRSSVATSAAMAGAGTGGDAAFTVPFADPEDPAALPVQVSMMELGFVPTFYQFVDTVIDVRLSVSLRRTGADGGRLRLDAVPVDAHFAGSYSYAADLAATLHTKLVPIPAPPGLDERIAELARSRRVETDPDPEPEPPES